MNKQKIDRLDPGTPRGGVIYEAQLRYQIKKEERKALKRLATQKVAK